MDYARRDFLKTTALATAAFGVPHLSGCSQSSDADKPPNFIVISCDDLGYGDLGCYGSQVHRTPNLDRMANEGALLTSFYSASGVCTPSRASIPTSAFRTATTWEKGRRQIGHPCRCCAMRK